MQLNNFLSLAFKFFIIIAIINELSLLVYFINLFVKFFQLILKLLFIKRVYCLQVLSVFNIYSGIKKSILLLNDT